MLEPALDFESEPVVPLLHCAAASVLDFEAAD